MDRAIFLWGNIDRADVKKIIILFIDLSALDARFEKCLLVSEASLFLNIL